MIQALRDAAKDNHWKIAWDELSVQYESGRAAEKGKNLGEAIRVYGKILVSMMSQIRKQRESEHDSVHD